MAAATESRHLELLNLKKNGMSEAMNHYQVPDAMSQTQDAMSHVADPRNDQRLVF